MDIRPCTLEDLSALHQLATTTFLDTFAAFNTPENVTAYQAEALHEKAFHEQLANPDSFFFLAYQESELAGYIKLNRPPAQTDLNDPSSMELERIYLLQRFHGQGLGKTMLSFAIEQAKSAGANYLWLGVWDQNTKAIQFYEQFGFNRFGEHDFYFGDDLQTDFLYRLDL